MDIEKWIETELQRCASKENELLGSKTEKQWAGKLNYWIGRRDLLWELERVRKMDTDLTDRHDESFL